MSSGFHTEQYNPYYLLKMGRNLRSEGLGTNKNLEIPILTLLFHQIFPRFRIELRHLASSKLEREIEFMEQKIKINKN